MTSLRRERGERLPTYGGQAVIEGVMMRGSRAMAVAVRAPDGSIALQTRPLGRVYRSRAVKVPFLRGLVVLWDALVLGVGALTFSANVQAGEDQKLEGAPLTLTLLVSGAIGISLFLLLPAGAAYLLEQALPMRPLASNLAEGLARLGILIGYIAAIGRLPEIERVYGYHGAEHKTINAFEANAPLSSETVARFPREHPRCGTSFLLTLVVLSVLLFSALGPLPLGLRLASRVLLLPVLASVSYEYLRISARAAGSRWGQPLVAPNLALQRLTTREPEPGMIEVAIAAFEAMVAEERGEGGHADGVSMHATQR